MCKITYDLPLYIDKQVKFKHILQYLGCDTKTNTTRFYDISTGHQYDYSDEYIKNHMIKLSLLAKVLYVS